MPTVQDNAIVIRRWDFSETSLTVSLLTERTGILRGLAKGAKREKGSFSGGMDVLTAGQVVAIVKSGRDLANITRWHLEEQFPILRRNLAANRAAWYMADLVHRMLIDHDPHPEVFRGLFKALTSFSEPACVARALVGFQWMLLCETGYRPQLETDQGPSDAPTLAFSPSAGRVVADTGEPDRWRVRRVTIELLRAIDCGEAVEEFDAETIDRANRLLATYVRELLGVEPHTMGWVLKRRSDVAT